MIQVSTGLWTADNTWISVDTTVSFEVTDPALMNQTTANVDTTVKEAVVWSLRSGIGVLPLAEALTCADEMNRQMPAVLNERMTHYGVRVTGFVVTAIAEAPEPASHGEDFEFLREPRFSVVLRGYDRGQVDDLVERARQALLGDGHDLRASLARELSQPIPVRLRGYDRMQVNNLRRLLAAALAAR
jgi:DivIVA domain-containing protein